jgi:predicted AlkP superfamily pyrophosphatase or phosphodiesterase
VAHIYIKDPQDIPRLAQLLGNIEGIDLVLDSAGKQAWHIDHPRAGELVAMAEPGYWFTYYYWLDDDKAPDFARTVDIHRKPGYDPVELFIDPDIPIKSLKILSTLAKKKLGFRTLFDVIPLKPELVHGTHGRLAASVDDGPILIGSNTAYATDQLHMTDIPSLILKILASQAL